MLCWKSRGFSIGFGRSRCRFLPAFSLHCNANAEATLVLDRPMCPFYPSHFDKLDKDLEKLEALVDSRYAYLVYSNLSTRWVFSH